MRIQRGLTSGIDPVRSAAAMLASRMWRRHRPLLVNLEPTHRCNLACTFCDKADSHGGHMDSDAAVELIGELARAGTLSICFDGGEPLVHPGLGRMVTAASALGLRVAISTNGTLLSKRLGELLAVDVLKISVDGPEEIHDAGRGKGAFGRALEGARMARDAGIRVTLRMTLASHNVEYWPDVLRIAESLGVDALFQPAIGSLLDATIPAGELSASAAVYRRAMDRITAAKRGGAPVANELACLSHLHHWPDPTPVSHCAGGRVQVAIGPDGSMYPCGRVGRDETAPNVFEEGVERAFRRVARPQDCSNCWCTLTLGNCLAYGLDPRLLEGRVPDWLATLGQWPRQPVSHALAG